MEKAEQDQVLRRDGRRAWIIADMDSTLVERPPSGLFPTLAESPCLQPILEWLRMGGGVCVVTTAARRSISQIWDCVPAELRAGRALVVSALEGGDLVYGDEAGEMVADQLYLASAAAGGGPTCFGQATLGTLLGYAESMVHAIVHDMQADRSILSVLSTKYHAPLGALLERLLAGEQLGELLSRPQLMAPGAVMTNTGERIISLNSPLMEPPVAPRVCTVSVMGFPGSRSKPYYENFVEKAAAVGADLSAAPNSLWFTPSGVSKATPIEWLKQHSEEYGFDINNAVAFGDCPHTNDGPLTQLRTECAGSNGCGEPAFCPFVSVAHAENAKKLPAHVKPLHVGGLEFGTARVVRGLLDEIGAQQELGGGPVRIEALLPKVVQRCQQQTAVSEAGGAIDGREV